MAKEKKLLIIRHAKSDWRDAYDIQDIDRSLKVRGVNDTYKMGERLQKRSISPDLLLSSSGIRALHTAVIMARTFNDCQEKIQVTPNLYHASATNILHEIQQVNNQVNTLFLFTHNPGINTFASNFISGFYENVPTCGVLCFSLECAWENVTPANVKFDFFDYPKKNT